MSIDDLTIIPVWLLLLLVVVDGKEINSVSRNYTSIVETIILCIDRTSVKVIIR